MDFFLLLFGIFMLSQGIYLIILDRLQCKHGYHTKGKVIEVKGKWSWRGRIVSYVFVPVIEFISPSNQLVELQLEAASSIPFYFEGQSVKIVYYKGKIYPTGIGWKLFNWVIVLIGMAVTVYHIILLFNSGFWQYFYAFGVGIVKFLRFILR